MKEFESTFKDGLKEGLRKHHANSRNTEALVECLNAKPAPDGLIPITAVTYLITDANGAVSWPFPQIFNTPME